MGLKALRLKNLNKLIIAHLNINSLRNKFEFLVSLIRDNIDVLMISKFSNQSVYDKWFQCSFPS